MSRMRTLWLRMAEIYGHRWTSAYGDNPDAGAGPTWAKGLEKLTPAQLAHGLTTAIASADGWPPTLPEFRSMCLGIPTFAAVKHELRTSKDTGRRSPFLRQVWSFIDGYMLARADHDKADRMLRDAYLLAAEYVMRGGQLPAPSEGSLEHERQAKPVPASQESVKRHLAEISQLLGIGEDENAGEFCHAQKGEEEQR